MKMNIYVVYVDDGVNCWKTYIPAESEEDAKKYIEGNGEVVSIRLADSKRGETTKINIDYLADSLRNSYSSWTWTDSEINLITRIIYAVGLEE
jgi:hypothetical protein